MSRAELADAVNSALDRLYPGRSLTAQYVDARWVGKLERGEHRWPSDERRTALRHVFTADSDSDIGLYNPRRTDAAHPARQHPPTDDVGDTDPNPPACEPDLTPIDDAEVGSVESPPVIHRRRCLITASNVDEARLSYLERVSREAIEVSEAQPPITLAPQIKHLRAYVWTLLGGQQPLNDRLRLYRVAVMLTGLQAATALDLGAIESAAAYGDEAFDLATVAGNGHLQAWARATQSLIAYYRGRFHDALAYALDGQRRDPGGPQTLRLIINGEARAHARLGNRYGVEHAVDRALTRQAATTPPATVSPSLAIETYCPARVAANVATAYLAVNQPDKVTQYATDALHQLDRSNRHGPQALSRLDLATAALLAKQPELELACHWAHQAMAVAPAALASVIDRTGEFLTTANRWASETSVREVNDMYRTYRTPPAISA